MNFAKKQMAISRSGGKNRHGKGLWRNYPITQELCYFRRVHGGRGHQGGELNKATGDPNGKTLYGEVEVEAKKNHEQRQAMWRNAFQVSGGEIYIFCDNCSSI
jgi:hypothetical protein